MKSSTLPIVAAFLSLGLLAQPLAVAQDQEGGGIKASLVQHPDGSRTETVKDLSAGTSEAKTFDAGNKLTQRVTYKLDENGLETEGIAYSGKGQALYQFTFARNSAGQITEERDLSNKGDLMRRLVYHFDSNGRVSGIDTYDAQGNLVSTGTSKKKPKASR